LTRADLANIQKAGVQKELEDPDMRVRARAWYKLIAHDVKSNLSDNLSDKISLLVNMAVRSGLLEIFHLGVDVIILAGASDNEEVRRSANTYAHSLLSDKRCVEILLARIKSSDPHARYIAAWGLKWTIDNKS